MTASIVLMSLFGVVAFVVWFCGGYVAMKLDWWEARRRIVALVVWLVPSWGALLMLRPGRALWPVFALALVAGIAPLVSMRVAESGGLSALRRERPAEARVR